MIAIDTSSLRRYTAGIRDRDTAIVADAVARHTAYLPPAVLSEALSDPGITEYEGTRIIRLPLLSISDGYWRRAGELRRHLAGISLKAKLPDTLIAQSCIDSDVPLITYDGDFARFVPMGLKLL